MPQKTILRTKLFRPRISNDFVDRVELFKRLSRSAKHRLTLVSASAGYGKSQTVSKWLDQSDIESTWLSLGENDSDLVSFFHYFLEAILHLFPDSCVQSQAILDAPVPCSREDLANELINDLSEISRPFHLVLDDYGFIHDPDIHYVLDRILEYDLPSLSLVLITRRDPPLSLTKLRGKGVLSEIRQTDLRFSLSETRLFLQTVVEGDITDEDCREVYDKLEGWPTGTRMIAIGLRGYSNIREFTREMRGDTRDIRDYLMSEVLSHQPAAIRDYLVKTSILNRMCPSLCEALCDQPEVDGSMFLQHLERSNLFYIPLDGHNNWFRYHHLFQSLLRYSLEKRFSPGEILALHERAHWWLSENGFIEDAMHHALSANNMRLAVSLVAANKSRLMEKEEWQQLRRLVLPLPVELLQSEPEIMMIGAWSLIGFPEMNPVLDSIETIMLESPQNYLQKGRLWGEFLVLRSLQSYLDTDGDKALLQATKALECLPEENGSERGFGVIMQAVALQMKGKTLEGQKLVLHAMSSNQSKDSTYHARLLSALCFVYWMDGALKDLQRIAQIYLELGQRIGLSETVAHAHFFLGVSSYEMNDIETAFLHLSQVVEKDKTLKLVNRHNYIHSGFALSYVYLEMGMVEKARLVTEEIVKLALEISNPYILSVANAFEADLAVRLGPINDAMAWSKTYDPSIMRPALRFYTPRLTLARAYLAEGSADSLSKVASFLTTLENYFTKISNFQFQIKVLTLQALLNEKLGDKVKAIEKLTDAFALAESRGFVRTFVDMGQDMADLLTNFPLEHPFGDYAKMLLSVFPEANITQLKSQKAADKKIYQPYNKEPIPPALTIREHEIIVLLHKRLSNQEIADNLYISYGTVKRHTANIYNKLQVKNRREAVDKAVSLKIIS
ncbi:MAG: LuxR C-terminal-related transcriptional regulator [Desulforhopalus sp.]